MSDLTSPQRWRADHSSAKKFRKPAMVLAFLVGALLSSNVWAQYHHGGHGHHGHHGGHGEWRGHGHGHARAQLGIGIGAPLAWGPGWYDPWYRPYYGMPLVGGQAPPVVYIERSVVAAPAPVQWYFCSHPQGYYPYIKHCATAWRTVDPQSLP